MTCTAPAAAAFSALRHTTEQCWIVRPPALWTQTVLASTSSEETYCTLLKCTFLHAIEALGCPCSSEHKHACHTLTVLVSWNVLNKRTEPIVWFFPKKGSVLWFYSCVPKSLSSKSFGIKTGQNEETSTKVYKLAKHLKKWVVKSVPNVIQVLDCFLKCKFKILRHVYNSKFQKIFTKFGLKTCRRIIGEAPTSSWAEL